MVGAETVLANQYGTHPIVRSLSAESLPVVFPLARSVTKAEKPPEGVAETMLVETSADGWGETNLKALAEGNGRDPEGRRGHARARVRSRSRSARRTRRRTGGKAARLVVIGNSRFAANGALANGGNGDPVRERHPLADREREADRHRAEDARAGVAVADRLPGAPDRPLRDRRDCRASRSSSASGSGTGAGTDPAVSARKLLLLTAVVVGALRVHRSLRAQDADDGRAPAQGRPLLGPSRGPADGPDARRAVRRPSSSRGPTARLVAAGQARRISRGPLRA